MSAPFSRSGEVKDAKKCEATRYTEPANGIAIVDAFYAQNVNGCLRQRPTKKTLDETLSLVDGQVPTFLSFACRHHRNKRQQKEHDRRMLLKTSGVTFAPRKCEERRELERDGGILILDGYLNRHVDTVVSEISSPYRTHFASHPPRPDATAPPRLRLSKMTKYLVDEAVLGHRPVFERVPTSEVYGDGCDYSSSVEALAEAEVAAEMSAKAVSPESPRPSGSRSTSSVTSNGCSDDALWSPASGISRHQSVDCVSVTAYQMCIKA